jgi:adenylyltransferase/sulfurtransferase
VIGLGGAGAATALGLAAAGVGQLVCIDSEPIAPADVYFSPFLGIEDVGRPRASIVHNRIRASAPQVAVETVERAPSSEDDLRSAIGGANYVVCCLDPGQLNLALKLNRVCLADKRPWITCSLAGEEVVVGPAIHPGDGPCFLCYRMRAVACTNNPEEAFAHEKYLDRRRADDGFRREGLTFGAGLAASLLGSEVLKALTGSAMPSLVGRVMTIALADLIVAKHTILRKPGCPACFGADAT